MVLVTPLSYMWIRLLIIEIGRVLFLILVDALMEMLVQL